ncbi:DUF3145 family protein [Micrococcales bacterium 31B]|nr:DUF3145 family protein [Micrococcales bacterium 31B]
MANATRGIVLIHSAPRALASHIETMLDEIVERRYSFQWISQPAGEGLWRAETTWQGPAGSGAALASRLRLIKNIRFEVTEEPSHGSLGSRYSHTPGLGIHHVHIDSAGNALVNEMVLNEALDLLTSDPRAARHSLRLALGQAWDEELESFRHASEGAPVRWLHNVG